MLAAERHGLTPLLEEALGGHLDAALGRRAALELRSLGALHRRRSRAQEIAMGEIVEAAREAGLGICWLKGAAVSTTVYARPSLRPMGDLDLLVAPADAGRAGAVLERLGFSPRRGSWRRKRLSHQLPPGVRGEGSTRVVVEIHVDGLSYLAPGSMVLGSGAEIVELPARHGGGTVATLGPTDTLAQLVAHAVNVRQRFTLIHLADIARWVERFDDRIDWERLHSQRPLVMQRLSWLAQLVPFSASAGGAARRAVSDIGVGYRGWSRQGLRASRREVGLGRLLVDTLVPPEWWARAQYGAADEATVFWLRVVRHPAHLLRVAFHRLVEG